MNVPYSTDLPSLMDRKVAPVRQKVLPYGGLTSVGNPLNVMSLARRPVQQRPAVMIPQQMMVPQESFESLDLKKEDDMEMLKFYAYFAEPLLEYDQSSRPYETERIRKCVINYYVKDATLSIEEPRTKNSGYVQGKLLKRSQVTKGSDLKNSPAYGPLDFDVGETLEIFGRSFVIVDADGRTRQLYGKHFDKILKAAIEYPDDGFDAERARVEIKYKQAPSILPGKGAPPAFRNNDDPFEMCLRFSCAYQDDRPDGEATRHFTLLYYVADDTVEIKENCTDGVLRFPNLLRRSKLPRNVSSVPENPLADVPKISYVTWQDLRCGAAILVWGRPVLLLTCDRRTEAWFMNRGIIQQPLQVAPNDPAAFPCTLPPFNGFGAENDLYAMGLSLQPAIINSTQDDYKRFMAADNKVLRFECVLAPKEGGAQLSFTSSTSSLESSGSRNFVINYYLGDDTIMVYEPPVRNSGFTGGIFLTRMRYKKHIPDHRGSKRSGLGSVLSRWLRPADFYEGAEVAFEAPTTGRLLQTFQVVNADDYTKRVEREKNLAEGSRLAVVVQQLAERLCATRLQVRSTFKSLDPLKLRCLPASTFRACLVNLEAESLRKANSQNQPSLLDDDLLEEMCWHYSKKTKEEEETMVWYDEFVDALVVAAPMPQIPELKASSTTNVKHKALEQCLVVPLRLQKADASANNGSLRMSFHAEDPENTGKVGADAWYRVLRKHKLHGVLSRDEADQLKQRYSEPSELQAGVEYERLCDKVFEGDFQDYMAALLMVLPERGDLSSVDLSQYRKQLEGGNKIPTVRNYLDDVNVAIRDCGGDIQRKLQATMRAFSSAFGRNHRQKMLRKHLMAFDTANSGSCKRDDFDTSVKRIISEGYCDLDTRALALLVSYVFPAAYTRQPYDTLLELLIARDVKGIMNMHNQALDQQEDPRFLFR